VILLSTRECLLLAAGSH